MNWDELIGHKDVVKILQAMLASGKVPHALLFIGAAGIGKSLVARLLAAGLLCGNSSAKPCGHCQACLMYSHGAHPDFTLVCPDGASIKIDQIRALKQFAALAPSVSSGRVCIIEDAEFMTVQAANSLLKLLEEPPPGFVFILVAGTAQPLLPTILSRCRKIQFQPLPPTILAEALVSKGYAAESAVVAAKLSGGRMGKALGLLAPDGLAARDMAAGMIEGLSGQDTVNIWNMASQLDGLETKEILTVLGFLLYLFRDMVLLAGKHNEQLLYNIDLAPKLVAHTAKWPEGQSLAALGAVKDTIRAISGNANSRLALEALLIHLKDLAGKGD
ncbi:hypothetical protein SCACP_02250 [Sporomusa carbonis]|uniref:DNA polymerase III subunit delta' n=1 Tax=Sporomusa carbonis TaxID=3076075 RepID=UPI003A6C8744